MRLALAAALIATVIASAASMPASARGRGPWCVIENDGNASWICYPTHGLCQRFGETPGTGLYCVQNPAWSGGG
ncbi:MAG TPA: DUF3551 domain-containing protein [Pseudolabrys sp.]|jgi:hypothetical protein|nr:DUF3551 domain-containing protein [Pseudolabrys sp.]